MGRYLLHVRFCFLLRLAFTDNNNAAMFPYTGGRWLHLDRQQRDARHVKFDFDHLCEKVLSLYPSATSIKNIQKIEGGFSKVFIIRTDNDENVVVKLPTSVAGSARHITNSEVATIMYCKEFIVYQTYIPTLILRVSEKSYRSSNSKHSRLE